MRVTWLLVGSLFPLAHVAGGPEKIRCDPEKVTAEVGKSVTFHCRTQSGRSVYSDSVEWTRNDCKKGRNEDDSQDVHIWRNEEDESQDVHAWREGVDDLEGQDPAFKGRTKLFPEKMKTGNVSLQLSHVTKEDEGMYSVTVNGETKSTVTLSVENPQDQDKEHGESEGRTIVGASAVLFVSLVFIVALKAW